MIPLAFATPGKRVLIVRIGGDDKIKHHLEDIGFVVGSFVDVLSSHDGDVIVVVKDVRLAVTRDMALKILVSEDNKEE